MLIPIVIFFSVIGIFVFFLLLANVIATKYLNGDYFEARPVEDDDGVDALIDCEEEKSQIPPMRGLPESIFPPEYSFVDVSITSSVVSPYKALSGETAMSRIEKEGFTHTFASHTKLKLTFEYSKTSSVIFGCVISIDGLSFVDMQSCPDEICFHVKIVPNGRKHRSKTKWKDVSSKVLSLTYKLGPLSSKIDPESKICVRLYGKRKGLTSKSKCHGELFVRLSKVIESNGVLDITRRLLPKSTSSIDSESSCVTSDTEKEK